MSKRFFLKVLCLTCLTYGRRQLLQGVVLLLTASSVFAAPISEPVPSAGALRWERQWLTKHLLSGRLRPAPAVATQDTPAAPEQGLDVMANNGPVTENGRGPHLMKIGNREYSRRLYCHAVSRIELRLPGPGKRFTAVVGLDHNDNTARGRGSVVFRVRVEAVEKFRGEVPFRCDVVRWAGTNSGCRLGRCGDLHTRDRRCR